MNQRVEEATAVTEAAIVEVEQETVQENGTYWKIGFWNETFAKSTYYWFFLGIADSASDEPYEQFEDENRDIDNAKEALLQVILISFSEIGKRFRYAWWNVPSEMLQINFEGFWWNILQAYKPLNYFWSYKKFDYFLEYTYFFFRNWDPIWKRPRMKPR